MKRETLTKRLNKLNCNKNCSSYKMVADLLGVGRKTYHVEDCVIRPCWTTGRGRFCSNQDYTIEVCNMLHNLGIKYELNNDAPRGGLTGNYIKVTTKITD